jgi:membrane protein
MFSSTFLIALGHYAQLLPDFIEGSLPNLNFGLAFVIFWLFFAVLLKYLPDAHLEWKDVLVGAAFTSFFFTLGEFLIGRFIGSVGLSQGYGAASSLILILLWVYYSMQIILIGAKFTQVYADRHGKTLRPSPRAERLFRNRQE